MNQSLMFVNQDEELGYISYNGVKFPPMHSCAISAEPVYDLSSRKRKHNLLRIRVEFVLVAGMTPASDDGTVGAYQAQNTTDDVFGDLRRRLDTPGGELVIVNKGWGSKAIYGSRTQYAASSWSATPSEAQPYIIKELDVDNGPRPKVIGWAPFNNRACRVVWECEAAVMDCPSTDISSKDILNFSYSTSFEVDIAGLTSINYTGVIRLPAVTTESQRDFNKRVYKIRRKLEDWFPQWKVMDRTYPNFEVADDRKEIKFSITDKERGSDNAYFPGLVEMSAVHRASSDWKVGFGLWNCSLNFSATVKKGHSKFNAWLAASLILKDILINSKYAVKAKPSSETFEEDTKDKFIITSRTIDDDIFGREISITINWTLFTVYKNFFPASGILKPLNNEYGEVVDNNLWLQETSNRPMGYQLEQSSSSSTGVSAAPICQVGFPTGSEFVKGYGREYFEGTEYSNDLAGTQPITSEHEYSAYQNSPLAASFNNDISLASDPRSFESMDLIDNESPVEDVAEGSKNITNPAYSKDGANLISPTKNTGSASRAERVVTRSIGSSIHRAFMRGWTVMLGVASQPAALFSVGGAKVTKTGRDRTLIKKIADGEDYYGNKYPIYATFWDKEYLLHQDPVGSKIVSDGNPEKIPTYTVS